MNKSEFKNPAGKIVQIGMGRCAFVPGNLPPKIDYSAVAEIAMESSRCIAELSELLETVSGAEMLARPMIAREAMFSSMIEGIQAPFEDIFVHEAGTGSARHGQDNDVLETVNCMHAIYDGISSARRSGAKIDVLKRLHRTLMKNDLWIKNRGGEIRKIQNFIGTTANIDRAIYVPPPPGKLEVLVGKLARFVQNKPDGIPTPVWCAIAHYQFEAIHPFIDGNGRMGRILFLLMLVQNKDISLPVINLSEYLLANQAEYYELMRKVSQESRWEDWIEFFLTGITVQSKAAGQSIKRAVQLRSDLKKRALESGCRPNAMRLLECLFEHQIVTADKAAKCIRTGRDAAQRAISQLIDSEILAKVGTGRQNMLYASPSITNLHTQNPIA